MGQSVGDDERIVAWRNGLEEEPDSGDSASNEFCIQVFCEVVKGGRFRDGVEEAQAEDRHDGAVA